MVQTNTTTVPTAERRWTVNDMVAVMVLVLIIVFMLFLVIAWAVFMVTLSELDLTDKFREWLLNRPKGG